MGAYLPLALALLAAFWVPMFVWGYYLASGDRPVPADMAAPRPARGRALRSSGGPLTSFADVLGAPFGPMVLRLFDAPRRARLRRRIEQAGTPGGMTVESYARQKAGYTLFFGASGLVFALIGQAPIGVLLAIGGFFQVDIVLWSRSRRRQEEIQRTLPDFLDVLAVTVSAGLEFRHALGRVAASMPGALADEMNLTLQHMDLGTPRRDAFEDLRRRNDNESLSSFVTALLQAEELGSPLAQALTEISADMRRESAQHSRRRAQRAEPRITVVTTFVIMPGVIILVIGSIYYASGTAIQNVLG